MNSIRLSLDELISEFAGVFFLTFLSSLTSMMYNDPTLTGVVIFMLYAFFSYVNLRFSAAHLNPAVSLTYLVAGEISMVKCLLYVGAHLGASMIAGFLLLFFKSLSMNNLGQPWVGKFPNSEQWVVSPLQGKLRLLTLSACVGNLHFIFPDVRDHEEHLG
jgi:glycerol uptake facilitator-like aquaporin